MLLAAATLFAAGTIATPVQAGCGIACKSDQCCPKCNHVCKLTAEKVDVEKKCYEVETDYICIPRVVFPWQRPQKSACNSCTSCDGKGCKSCSACPNNGARIRKIKKLTSKKYKCPECEYTWEAEKKGGCGSCGGGSCSNGCCSSGNCDTGCDTGCACGSADYSEAPTPPALDSPPAPMQHSSGPAMLEPVQTEVHGAIAAPVYQEQIPSTADYYAPAQN
jgi:hypothetical protein